MQHFLTAFHDTRQNAIISRSALRNRAGSRQSRNGIREHSIGQKISQFRNKFADMYPERDSGVYLIILKEMVAEEGLETTTRGL